MIRLNCDDWIPVVRELNKPIRDWYVNEFPTDNLGPEIPKKITFFDAVGALNLGADIYSFIGVGDSVMRERLFRKIAEIIGCDYNVVYRTWLGG